MYKKTLAAVAILGAFAGSSMAANVTLYGKADLGLNYAYSQDKNVLENTKATANTLKMENGQYAGSRFGLKGTEDLGNGLTVGFKLENGFSADTGKLGQGSRLFGREAVVYLNGDFGTIGAGRMGDLSSGCGSYSSIWNFAAMGSGWGNASGSKDLYSALADRSRMDNTLVYVTPDFAGFTATAQYSFNADGDENDHVRQNTRYAGLGLNYNAGAFAAGLVVDTVMVPHADAVYFNKDKKIGLVDASDRKDDLGVSLGASFDMDVAKLYGLVQYGAHQNSGLHTWDKDTINEAKYYTDKGVKAWSTALGVSAPVAGGTFYSQFNYKFAKASDVNVRYLDGQTVKTQAIEKAKETAYGLAAGYDYALSKRTTVYTFGSYGLMNQKVEGEKVAKAKVGEFGFGLAHSF